MREERYDVIIIGGGPAGIASAIRAAELGLEPVIVENGPRLGGILLQCIHPGFGIHYFKEDLTGPEFALRLIDKLESLGVKYLLNAFVHSIENASHDEKNVVVITRGGVVKLRGSAIIYAAGARERHQYEIGILGDRPAGVYTAGEAQALMDILGKLPGREVVIVGSGDVGMIVARRFALEGARVKAVVEMLPYPGGLTRNYIQCLRDFDIPLLLSHVVKEIRGRERVEKVVVAKVDESLRPIEGTEFEIECDAVILAAGLVPNVSLLEKIGVPLDPATRGPIVNDYLESLVPGIFVAGNALLINDLVDYVVEQGQEAANGVKAFVDNGGIPSHNFMRVVKGRNVRLAAPHLISGEKDVIIYARVERPEANVFFEIPELQYRIFFRRVRPAEMIRLKLSKRVLQRASGSDKITLRVVQA